MTRPTLSRAAAGLAAPLALLLAFACAAATGARAQSGRKAQKPLGLPTEQAPKQGEPAKTPESKKPDAIRFVVMRSDEGMMFGIDPLARDGVAAAFVKRLGQSSSIEVTDGGKGNRSTARERAKKEEQAFVVVFSLEEQGGQMSVNQVDSRTLVLRTYVYTPKTADLKYADTMFQRPHQETARIGGVRVPVPTRRPERYPSQNELEQAARDAADRLLGRFSVTPPPER